ncbi:hypothetical protein KY285_023363 [Solanum tuberosum]|nr:hypothetical protein KY289_023697 [Solanum tuberosum]KAH0675562.1 hypothetical protein KY285_023363 [Solanum tuberosum]
MSSTEILETNNKSDKELGDQNITDKGINTKNAFDALSGKNEKEPSEESTGGNDRNENDLFSEVMGQGKMNKGHHYSSMKEWITYAFAKYQGKGEEKASSCNRNTEKNNTNRSTTHHNGEIRDAHKSGKQQQDRAKDDIEEDTNNWPLHLQSSNILKGNR